MAGSGCMTSRPTAACRRHEPGPGTGLRVDLPQLPGPASRSREHWPRRSAGASCSREQLPLSLVNRNQSPESRAAASIRLMSSRTSEVPTVRCILFVLRADAPPEVPWGHENANCGIATAMWEGLSDPAGHGRRFRNRAADRRAGTAGRRCPAYCLPPAAGQPPATAQRDHPGSDLERMPGSGRGREISSTDK